MTCIRKEHKSIRAYHCENAFESINNSATDIGMVINSLKTQLICISDDRNSTISSYIDINKERVHSQENLKILGFIFDQRPSVDAHVNYCCDKFNRAIWSLNHLHRAKIPVNTLLQVYLIMLRPLLEYCSPVYHHMLTVTLSEKLERQQRRALKIIYGFGLSYSALLEKTGIPTLKERRETACRSFTNKLLVSNRFQHLFPLNAVDDDGMTLRNTRQYTEEFARSERLYRSPLYSMRRNLNNQ